MRFTVKVAEEVFEVEVGDLRGRPIVAVVDGECFEIWPEAETACVAALNSARDEKPPSQSLAAPLAVAPSPRESRRTSGAPTAPNGNAARIVYAPIPGVIDSITVQPGDAVAVGQELCVLEAMKMKNVIRASRTGEIAHVKVAVGQHVKHNDALLEYID